jgi:hypothetical protein
MSSNILFSPGYVCGERDVNSEAVLLLVPGRWVGWDRSVGTSTCYGLIGPGIESAVATRFSAPVQTCRGAHPASNLHCGGWWIGRMGVQYKTAVHVGYGRVTARPSVYSGFPWFISPAQYQQFLIRMFDFFLTYARRILRQYPITSDDGVLPNPYHLIVCKNLSIQRYWPTSAVQQVALNTIQIMLRDLRTKPWRYIGDVGANLCKNLV